jgi:hypothetical protein
MPPLAIVKTEVPDRHPDPLAQLAAERTLVTKDLAEVDRRRARLGEAEAAKSAIVAALNALGEREMEAVRVWVGSACEGEQPRPDAPERAHLTDRLAALTRAAEIARTASADLDAEAGRLQGRLGAIARQVFEAKLAAVLEDLPALEAATVNAMRTQNENLLKLRALMIVLSDEQSAAFNQGDEERAALLRAAMQRVEGLQKPKIEQTYPDMIAASAAWRARLK